MLASMNTREPTAMRRPGPAGECRRPVRSFVLRAGRLTAAQQRALETLWPRYGIDYAPRPLELDAVFGRHAPRVLEIGFGNGDALLAMAEAMPGHDFLGIEVHAPGIGHCLLGLERRGLTNVRLIRHDALEVLAQQIPDGALARVNLFFPDPWPKKRHHKRRLVQPAFVALMADKLEPGGLFHVATDWPDYARQIEEVLAACAALRPAPRLLPARPGTRFEARGQQRGHPIWEGCYRRV